MNFKEYLIESSDATRKAKLDKVIKAKRATAGFGHNQIIVELIGDKWPSDIDLIWYVDYPHGAPFGGRVSKSVNSNEKYVVVHTD